MTTFRDHRMSGTYNDCSWEITYTMGVWSLTWTDNVANEWSEDFPSLSVATARLAVLFTCGESDWEKCFIVGADDFVQFADEFLNQQALA